MQTNNDLPTSRMTVSRKPKRCRQCRSSLIADVLYGLIDVDTKLEEAIAKGEVICMGCCDVPGHRWKCRNCGMDFFKGHVQGKGKCDSDAFLSEILKYCGGYTSEKP